ncbi:type II methionyl aminopeptidase [Candidatus Micrarchaeota archaeon]|nr:type II methionyl aminopeptidase [Candidatus Micrarchaeota archaeon]
MNVFDDTEDTDLAVKSFMRSGEICRRVREEGAKLVMIDASLLEAAEEIEELIRKAGGEPAFPCNISVNEQAAHSTPSFGDKQVFGEKDVVKLDLGAHVDGFVADTAITIDLSGENGKLVEASKTALDNAISIIHAGAQTRDIGSEIASAIESYKFKPIRNLSGHGVGEYVVHMEPSIPNYRTPHTVELKEGDVIALEPFASTGAGMIREDRRTEIFSFERPSPVRNQTARQIIEHVASDRQNLPFAERWLYKRWPEFSIKLALRELLTSNAFRGYPILKEDRGTLVSQHEHTLIVEKDSCKVIT